MALFSHNPLHEKRVNSQEAVYKLVIHVLDTTGADHERSDNHNDNNIDYPNPLQIYFHNPSASTVLHTLTHQISNTSTSPRSYKIKTFRVFLIDTGATGGITSSVYNYLTQW